MKDYKYQIASHTVSGDLWEKARQQHAKAMEAHKKFQVEPIAMSLYDHIAQDWTS